MSHTNLRRWVLVCGRLDSVGGDGKQKCGQHVPCEFHGDRFAERVYHDEHGHAPTVPATCPFASEAHDTIKYCVCCTRCRAECAADV